MRIGSLFSGYGGLDLAVEAVTGGETVWVSDIDPGANKILQHHWPDVPNHGDIAKIDWAAVEPVDVVTGGFPCQDVSHAGKRAGLRPDTRTGLWSQMAYAIDQLRPSLVVAENVRGLLSAEAHGDLEPCPWCVGDGPAGALRALGAVLGDLADIGYDARWTGLRAASIGAPHGRFRIFVVAWPAGNPDGGAGEAGRYGGHGRGSQLGLSGEDAADADRQHVQGVGRVSGLVWRSDPRTLLQLPPGQSPADPGSERHGGGEDGGGVGRVDSEDAGETRERERPRGEPGDRSATATSDTAGARCSGRQDTGSGRGDARTGTRRGEPERSAVAWGTYEPAIRRWERTLGRLAPAPTEPGPKGGQRLSPAFVEWMMGLPAGHVCDVPGLTRNEQLKALGNGVVPQQAAAALTYLLQALEVAA